MTLAETSVFSATSCFLFSTNLGQIYSNGGSGIQDGEVHNASEDLGSESQCPSATSCWPKPSYKASLESEQRTWIQRSQ